MSIRTRFAPSPTGYLHIGGVRTALFNWLLAKRHAGQFILRIDDTDDARNCTEAVKPIVDGFAWLGMSWDEGPTSAADGTSFGPHAPYYQGQRNDKYEAAAMKLLAEGKGNFTGSILKGSCDSTIMSASMPGARRPFWASSKLASAPAAV